MEKTLPLVLIGFGIGLSAHAQTQQPEYYKPSKSAKAPIPQSED